jgi:CBS-domain-containing membrane protein
MAKVLAQDLMSRPVRQVTAWTPVAEAAAFLLRHGISGAPVLDEHGRWIGVFTQNDLARAVENRLLSIREVDRSLETREPLADPLALPPEELGKTPVRAFMTRGLFTVFPDASVKDVLHTMNHFKVHRVFVIDEQEGTLLGVITTMDVMRWMERMRASSKNLQDAQRPA